MYNVVALLLNTVYPHMRITYFDISENDNSLRNHPIMDIYIYKYNIYVLYSEYKTYKSCSRLLSRHIIIAKLDSHLNHV